MSQIQIDPAENSLTPHAHLETVAQKIESGEVDGYDFLTDAAAIEIDDETVTYTSYATQILSDYLLVRDSELTHFTHTPKAEESSKSNFDVFVKLRTATVKQLVQKYADNHKELRNSIHKLFNRDDELFQEFCFYSSDSDRTDSFLETVTQILVAQTYVDLLVSGASYEQILEIEMGRAMMQFDYYGGDRKNNPFVIYSLPVTGTKLDENVMYIRNILETRKIPQTCLNVDTKPAEILRLIDKVKFPKLHFLLLKKIANRANAGEFTEQAYLQRIDLLDIQPFVTNEIASAREASIRWFYENIVHFPSTEILRFLRHNIDLTIKAKKKAQLRPTAALISSFGLIKLGSELKPQPNVVRTMQSVFKTILGEYSIKLLKEKEPSPQLLVILETITSSFTSSEKVRLSNFKYFEPIKYKGKMIKTLGELYVLLSEKHPGLLDTKQTKFKNLASIVTSPKIKNDK